MEKINYAKICSKKNKFPSYFFLFTMKLYDEIHLLTHMIFILRNGLNFGYHISN